MDPHRRILPTDPKSAGKDKKLDPPSPSISPPSPPAPPHPHPSPPPLSPNSKQQSSHRITNFLLISTAIIAATVLLSLTYYAVLRRRRRRRPLRDVALAVHGGGGDEDGASFGGEEPFHHVWYIRTVGLDESTIASIAVAEYRAGDGLLEGTSSCSVCLGDFSDGESVRLLPKCGHAFHVACIDTWLRAHANCPLCRAHIVEPDGDPAAAAALAITDSDGSVDSDSVAADSAEVPQIGIQAPEEQERVLDNTFDIGLPVHSQEAFDSLPESSSSGGQGDDAYGWQPVRRSVSMDAPIMNSFIAREDPEQGTTNKDGEKTYFEEDCATKGNSSKGVVDHKSQSEIERSLSSSGGGFFFSRHGRVARIHSLPI